MSPRKNPALIAVLAEGFGSRLSFGVVTFALPLYARELGLSLSQIGLLASLNLIVAVALKPAMGPLADRVGLKKGLSAAIALRTVVSVLLTLATLPWHLFATRALHGVSIALRDPATGALIAEHGGARTIAQSFAWYQTAKTVAGSLSKVAAGVLITLTAANYSVVFAVAAVLSLLPLLAVVRWVAEPTTRTVASDHEPQGPPPPGTLRFAGVGFLISGSGYMLNTFFPILATEYAGLTAAQAGLLYSVSAVVALTGPAFGWLSDNVSRGLVLRVRSVANVLSSVLYLVAPSFLGFAAGRVFDDAGKAAFRPAWGALMAEVSGYDRRRRARTIARISAGEDAGEICGPLLAGILWSAGGVPLLLGGRIAVAAVAELYTTAVTGSAHRAERPPRSRYTWA